jgi:hypothetical protein
VKARRFRIALIGLAALALPFGSVAAAPPPIPFCLPDLDGHCRYCEIRFAPISVRCVGG